MNEEELCKKRLLDLSGQADRRGIALFSDFLNLNEQNIYHQIRQLFATRTESFGGVSYAERQMIAFIPDALSLWGDTEIAFPITALRAVPASPRFAEALGHRDILGALMNLGIDRGRIGDIIVGDGEYFILCERGIAEFVTDQLRQIRHTAVRLEACAADEIRSVQTITECDGIITSVRLDAVIACICHLSRSQAAALITKEKVFVGGKLMHNPSAACHPQDIISVRGYGRFVFLKEYGETKKGRIRFVYGVYGRE